MDNYSTANSYLYTPHYQYVSSYSTIWGTHAGDLRESGFNRAVLAEDFNDHAHCRVSTDHPTVEANVDSIVNAGIKAIICAPKYDWTSDDLAPFQYNLENILDKTDITAKLPPGGTFTIVGPKIEVFEKWAKNYIETWGMEKFYGYMADIEIHSQYLNDDANSTASYVKYINSK